MLLSALSGFAVALVCVQLLLRVLPRLALDTPNERSLHRAPVPRTGGIAILLGGAAALALGGGAYWLPAAFALGLAVVSFVDDLMGLPSGLRFATHVLAAAVCIAILSGTDDLLLFVVLVLAAAWITNLYNFMDGSDGLAGGMAVIGFGAYALAAHWADAPGLASLCLALSAAAAAFLLHNFHPARIFMGDVGSIPLGFLAAILGLNGWHEGAWPLWFPLLVFSPFIVDATFTLARRLARGERVWRAHREHYYQRMVRMGFGHRRCAAIEYVLMFACAGAALLAREFSATGQGAVLVAAGIVYLVLAVLLDRAWSRHERNAVPE